MKKLEALQATEKVIETIEKKIVSYMHYYKMDGSIDDTEQAVLDALKAKVTKAKAELAKQKKEYFALFNNTNLQGVDGDKVKLITKYDASTHGTKVVLTPAKPNGKTIYFFFGYVLGSVTDMKMREEELAYLEDDVIDAAERGFKVVYDKSGTKGEFEAAIYDSSCYGIYWSGHGGSGAIQTSDGKMMNASDFDPTKVSSKLQFLIFAACKSGTAKDAWEKLIKKKAVNAEFQGWVENTSTSETNDFTDEAYVGDSWYSHSGTDTDKELDDYIDKSEKAK